MTPGSGFRHPAGCSLAHLLTKGHHLFGAKGPEPLAGSQGDWVNCPSGKGTQELGWGGRQEDTTQGCSWDTPQSGSPDSGQEERSRPDPPYSYLQSRIHGQVQFLSTQALRPFLLCRQTSTNRCPAQEEEKMGDQRGNGGNVPVSMVCNQGQVLSVT